MKSISNCRGGGQMDYWIIRNVNDNSLAWSNEFGWVDNDTYTVFSGAETEYLSLPIEGRWVPLQK